MALISIYTHDLCGRICSSVWKSYVYIEYIYHLVIAMGQSQNLRSMKNKCLLCELLKGLALSVWWSWLDLLMFLLIGQSSLPHLGQLMWLSSTQISYSRTEYFRHVLMPISEVPTWEKMEMYKHFLKLCLIWSTNIPLAKRHIYKPKIRPWKHDKVIGQRACIRGDGMNKWWHICNYFPIYAPLIFQHDIFPEFKIVSPPCLSQ